VAPGTGTSQFGLIGALIVKGHSKPVLTLPAQPLSINDMIASSSEKNTGGQKVSNAFGNINAYPNPFSGNFALSLNLPRMIDVQVEIYDINGHILYKRKFDNLMKGNNVLKITPPNSPYNWNLHN
jgi:hypothetical protein